MISASTFETVSGPGFKRCAVRSYKGQDDVFTPGDGDQEELRIVYDGWVVQHLKAGKLVKSFSGGGARALDAQWVRFDPYPKTDVPLRDIEQHIVILEGRRLRIYSPSGEEFLISLPCQIKRLWPTQCGVLLERQDDPMTDSCETNLDNDDPNSLAGQFGNKTTCDVADINVAMRPKLLALKHPLDDITRVICKSKVHSGKRGFSSRRETKVVEWTSRRHTVLFTSSGSDDPPVAVTYDNLKKCHHVWSVRAVFPDDEDVEEFNRTAMATPPPGGGGSNRAEFYLFPHSGPPTVANTPNHSSGVPSAAATPLASASHSFSSMMPGGGVASGANSPVMSRKSSAHQLYPGGGSASKTLASPFGTPPPGAAPPSVKAGRNYPASSTSVHQAMSRKKSGMGALQRDTPTKFADTFAERAAAGSCGGLLTADMSSLAGPSDISLRMNKSVRAIEFAANAEEPLAPAFSLSFELIWTCGEDNDGTSAMRDKARKVFWFKNPCGDTFLCFLLPHSGLVICFPYSMKVIDGKQKLVFGPQMAAVHIGIPGQDSDNSMMIDHDPGQGGGLMKRGAVCDAIPLPDLGMILTLEVQKGGGEKCLALHLPGSALGGGRKVANVHFNLPPTERLNVQNIAQEISGLHIHGSSEVILTSSRPPSRAQDAANFNESLALLSPVVSSSNNLTTAATQKQYSSSVAHPNGLKIVQVSHHVGKSAHVYLEGGHSFRLELPEVATSPLVSKCLKAYCAYMSSDSSLDMLTRWYKTRNAPGPANMSQSDEWNMFCQCLLSKIGYAIDKLKLNCSVGSAGTTSGSIVSPIISKKMKPNDKGSDCDWQHLLSTQTHKESGERLSYMLRLTHVDNAKICSPEDDNDGMTEDVLTTFAHDSSLHEIASILFCFHLLYEDLKLDVSYWSNLSMLATLLSMMAADLQLDEYVTHYWQDFPLQCPKTAAESKSGQLKLEDLNRVLFPIQMTETDNGQVFAPSIFKRITRTFNSSNEPKEKYPVLRDGVTKTSRDIVLFYEIFARSSRRSTEVWVSPPAAVAGTAHWASCHVQTVTQAGEKPFALDDGEKPFKPNLGNDTSDRVTAQNVVGFAVANNYDADTFRRMPVGVIVPVLACLYHCRMAPPLIGLSRDLYVLIGRPDLAAQSANRDAEVRSTVSLEKSCEETAGGKGRVSALLRSNIGNVEAGNPSGPSAAADAETDDGLDALDNELTKLRWPVDRRLNDVQRMLQSVRPVIVKVEQRPDMSDHDFVEEQERCLQSLCVRTMALPVGRGAVTLWTTIPLPTETLPIPKLCLIGKAPPRGTTVEMDHIEVVPHMEKWPTFHNGVAAGLRIVSSEAAKKLDKIFAVNSHWITFNKPKYVLHQNEMIEHGGFLMALGLNGHLANLGKLESFDYLVRGNEMISIGILLGTCAAKRGSMDILATKKISTQLEALLPPTATELPLSHVTQVAALAGLGLLYQSTGHRHMAEVCLGELGRPPGPEMENCTDRESYSLSAGLALGMITLGHGETLNQSPLMDLKLPETLYHHMVGGPRSPSVYRSRFRSPSYQIQEGDSINIDVTSPGATLALGLMFFRSGNRNIAAWMDAPDSQFLLEFVRPDFLMLRTLAKGLILWEDITPTSDWIDSHVPKTIRPHCLVRPAEGNTSVDYETINQAYCNIIAGAALAMALRFAGSCNSQAFDVLHNMTRRLMSISKRSIAELAGKATIEQTICVLTLSLCIVMAGSGDLEVIRIVRFLRSRVGPKNPTVTYGSHMALHMGLGLLFLGGGKCTLSTRPEAVAAMVAAFFPKFPTHSNDNRYHLQALRHLYVLAAEPRLVIPRDIEKRRLVFCHLDIEFADTPWYKGFSMRSKAPVMLPELNLLKRVTVRDSRYHEMVFDCTDEVSLVKLRTLLSDYEGVIDIQQKAGCLSYKEDPQGFRSLTTQCLVKDAAFQWSLAASNLLNPFATEPQVGHFNSAFLLPSVSNVRGRQGPPQELLMGSILYECASQEKMDVLPVYLQVFISLWQLGRPGQLFAGQQLALIMKLSRCSRLVNALVTPELVMSISQDLKKKCDTDKAAAGQLKSIEQLRTHFHLSAFKHNLRIERAKSAVSSKRLHNPLRVIKMSQEESERAMQH